MKSHHHLINQSPSRGSPLQEFELPLELPLAHQASSHHLFKLLDFSELENLIYFPARDPNIYNHYDNNVILIYALL